MTIKNLSNPNPSIWGDLVKRPIFFQQDLSLEVEKVMQAVSLEGDLALKRFTKKFDEVELSSFKVSRQELHDCESELSQDLMEAIDLAYQNIHRFHQTQAMPHQPIETMSGVKCWREARPIDPVGLYIPGGTAPLFSTVLMLGIPARIAGCSTITMCTPPSKDGTIAAAIRYAAKKCGIDHIYKIGGAQAIAAMTFGTESIQRVSKIFGPGNQFVTEAKMQAQRQGIAIDMPAGPSEVLVIADDSADPKFIASDLLSQAEHGPDSQVVLLSSSVSMIEQTKKELLLQLEVLPRKQTASKSLENSMAIFFDKIETCLAFSNEYAPEHLILSLDDGERWISEIVNAGSVFLGHFSPEAVGDYASGTNHTLPTNGWARSYSGVSLDSFVKKITFQSLTPAGLDLIGDTVEQMAEAEHLHAHKNAVAVRRAKIKNS